jgi:hypothetical protein
MRARAGELGEQLGVGAGVHFRRLQVGCRPLGKVT